VIYLADTNVILRTIFRSHPLNLMIRRAIGKLRSAGHQLSVATQNLIEFWNVATRPAAQNGFGKSLSEVERSLRIAERLFGRLNETSPVYPEWRRLAVTFGVSGTQVHDARLVAAMLVHGITHILTFNVSDVARYAPAGIVAVDPATV
jgi:predicted nucleic acid-binding protein